MTSFSRAGWDSVSLKLVGQTTLISCCLDSVPISSFSAYLRKTRTLKPVSLMYSPPSVLSLSENMSFEIQREVADKQRVGELRGLSPGGCFWGLNPASCEKTSGMHTPSCLTHCGFINHHICLFFTARPHSHHTHLTSFPICLLTPLTIAESTQEKNIFKCQM